MVKSEIISRRLELHKVVSRISGRFISFQNIDLVISSSLEDMGRFSSADRSYIFRFSKDEKYMDITHEWCKEGVTPQIGKLNGLSTTSLVWWMKKLKNREIIQISDVGKLPKEAWMEQQILKSQDVKSVLVLPIYMKKKLIGFIGFDNMKDQGAWKEEDLSLLQIASEIFSNAFDRIQVEQALKSSERKYRELFHNTNDIIFVHTLDETDDQLRFIEINDMACIKTGYKRDDFFAMTTNEVCSKKYEKNLMEMKAALGQTNHFTCEMELFTKDGRQIPVEVNAHTFVLDGKEVVMTIARDMTERINMEKELKKNNADLQNVIIKLRETQSQLIQQEQLAGIGQLAAGIAHEINNPLAYAMSNCDLLKEDLELITDSFHRYQQFCETLSRSAISGPLKQQLISLQTENSTEDMMNELGEITDDIVEGLKRVNLIVKGLSAFSRIDYQDVYSEYDLQEGMKNTLIVANNAYKYLAEIECDYQHVPQIEVNPCQINQVLLNLLLNAAYAVKEKHRVDKKKGLIRISIGSDHEYVFCRIEDDGIGIPKENLSKIFNPFFTTKPIGEGTGLGLSIAYDIMVNKHHGAIEVSSTPGEGSKFTLKFPLKKG